MQGRKREKERRTYTHTHMERDISYYNALKQSRTEFVGKCHNLIE